MDGGVYYAQFRGFLTDQYCEKSAVISWLLPTQNSPKPEDGFDPATYIIGDNDNPYFCLELSKNIVSFP